MTSRNWCFTLNNPEGLVYQDGEVSWAEGSEIPAKIAFNVGNSKHGFKFLIFQVEVGDSGTPHYQGTSSCLVRLITYIGYVQFGRPFRLSGVRKLLSRAHWIASSGSCDHNVHYCSKPVAECSCHHCAPEGVRLVRPRGADVGPWIHGTPSSAGQRTDLHEVRDDIKSGKRKRDLIDSDKSVEVIAKYPKFVDTVYSLFPPEEPEDFAPDVRLLYGPPGCGKTITARAASDLWISPIGHPGWFDGYDRHANALLDDFAGDKSHWTLTDFLRVSDRYVERLPIKGAFTYFRPRTIWITTNIHPYEWWKWEGREVQYLAVRRRITSITAWRSDGTDRTELSPTGTPALWDRFWSRFAIDGCSALGDPAELVSTPGDWKRKFDFVFDVPRPGQ